MAKEDKKTDDRTMTFDEGLDSKEDMLGEEIKVLSVENPKQGNLGGEFSVATVEYDGEQKEIAFGAVLSKQWAAWVDRCKTGSISSVPAFAEIDKPRGKRYYAFAYIKPA